MRFSRTFSRGKLPAPSRGVLPAVLAALLFGLGVPFSRLLLSAGVGPAYMASFLYLGAGAGMALVALLRRKPPGGAGEARLARRDWPYVLGMIALDVAAPFLLMLGLSRTAPENASLLGNFEIAATAFFAFALFREPVGKRLGAAVALILAGSVVLALESAESFSFSPGSLLVLAAAACWGLENNCTRMLSLKNPVEIVAVKGFGAGAGSLLLALVLGESPGTLPPILAALALGFVSYGLSIYFYVTAQRTLGAARTGALYAVAPFAGAVLSFLIFRTPPSLFFLAALPVMALGAYLAVSEKHAHAHRHAPLVHDHRHSHADGHHGHAHDPMPVGEHSHPHVHDPVVHTHAHTPDLHHVHSH